MALGTRAPREDSEWKEPSDVLPEGRLPREDSEWKDERDGVAPDSS